MSSGGVSCVECGKKFLAREEYVRVSGGAYHTQCILCSLCRRVIPKQSIVLDDDGKLCHEECLAVDCAVCGKSIGVAESAFDLDGTQNVHTSCLKCMVCRKPVAVAGKRDCRIFSDLRAVHDKCFQCSSCKKKLKGNVLHKHPYWTSEFYCNECGTQCAPCFCCERKFLPCQTVEYPGGFVLCTQCHRLGTIDKESDSVKAMTSILTFFQRSLGVEFSREMVALQTRDLDAEAAIGKQPPTQEQQTQRQRRLSLIAAHRMLPARRSSVVTAAPTNKSTPTFPEVIKALPVQLADFRELNEEPDTPASRAEMLLTDSLAAWTGEASPLMGSPLGRSLSPLAGSTSPLSEGVSPAGGGGGFLTTPTEGTRGGFPLNRQFRSRDELHGLERQVTLSSQSPKRSRPRPPNDGSLDSHFYGRTDCATIKVEEIVYRGRNGKRDAAAPQPETRTEFVRQVRRIVLLRGLPDPIHSANLAHELMHAWLFLEGYANLPAEVEEGLCNYVCAKYLEKKAALLQKVPTASNGLKAQLLLLRLWKMEKSKDPIYGEGYRLIKAQTAKKDFRALLRRYKVDPLGGASPRAAGPPAAPRTFKDRLKAKFSPKNASKT